MQSRFFPTKNSVPLVGFANSIWQSSGDKKNNQGEVVTKSNWSEAAGKNGIPAFTNSYNHYENYERDLDIVKNAGSNCYRFSIEWKDIEPQKGVIDQIAIAHYLNIIHACKSRDLEPMVTLLHFVEPYWFTEVGGFENEANIAAYFVPHCIRLFNLFHDSVKIWCTINEPALQAFSGYLYGQFPPHKHNLQTTLDVMCNLLKAHVEVYTAFKKLPDGEEAKIGIVHNVMKFAPGMRWEPIEVYLARFLTHITNHLVLNFFKSGEFFYHKWFIAFKRYSDPKAKFANDFIGLNYYATSYIGFNRKNIFGPTCLAGQTMGDMYLPLDPSGFGKAIDECAELQVPVLVTETGVCDNTDRIRETFIKDYTQVFLDKRASGVDVRGFLFWSLKKNIEWNEGDTKDFGFYNEDGTAKSSTPACETFLKNCTHSHESIVLEDTSVKRLAC